MTDQNLEQFFEQHRREFDGTRVRVAHLLLKVKGDGPGSTAAVVARAIQLRAQIRAGNLSFADAAKQFSAAPTGEKGGDLGFISRREPMSESFSRAAFALQTGEVSEPVVSTFGVHLIRCLGIEPGQQRWQDVRQELTRAVTEYLFTWAAGRERVQAKIEFTGAIEPQHSETATNSPE